MTNPMARIQRATYIQNDLVYEIRTNPFSDEIVNHWLLEIRKRNGSVVAISKNLSPQNAHCLIANWSPDVEIIYYS